MQTHVKASRRGFALAEMLVAMAIFLIVASAAFTLFNQHQAIVIQQQSLSSINIGLRNAMSQMEIDLAGAGQNVLYGATVSGAPAVFGLGVIVNNNVPGTATACSVNTTSWAYPTSSACYDSLQVVNTKQCSAGVNAPILSITDASDNMSNDSSIIAADVINPGNQATATADAACYVSGDELMILSLTPTASAPFTMTFVTLSATATAPSATVSLAHNFTSSSGAASGCPGSTCSDPLSISVGNQGNNYSKELTAAFTTGAYIVNLGTGTRNIWYSVQPNPLNATDPQLMRCTGAPCTSATGQVVADQVIGFKIGTALWNQAQSTDIASFFYNTIKYCNSGIASTDCTTSPPPANDPSNFSLLRSVRISMIGRTQPKVNQTFAQIQNGFDGGPYLVQQASVVVDLRNMSINEFGN